jgi:hypothetical protein
MGGSWGGVIWSGFVAAVIAAGVLWGFRAVGATRMSATGQLGCLFFDDPRLPMTETLGFALFLVLHASVVAVVYAVVLQAAGGAGWGRGALLGAVHGILLAALLPWLTRASRCVRLGRVPAPGRLGLEWGRATPVALLTGFAVYGGVFGAVLRALSTRAV